MPYTAAGKNAMLDAVGVTHASLHSDIPNSSGSNELTGGAPAYARQPISFAAAGGGSKAASTAPVFDVPVGTVMFMGFWTAVSGGSFRGYGPINGGSVKGVGTVTTADVITSYAHGLVNTDRITIQTVNGESLPTGLNETTVYFIVGATTDTFQVSLTSGGAAVDITGTGEMTFQKVIPEVFASQGSFTLNTATLDLNG